MIVMAWRRASSGVLIEGLVIPNNRHRRTFQAYHDRFNNCHNTALVATALALAAVTAAATSSAMRSIVHIVTTPKYDAAANEERPGNAHVYRLEMTTSRPTSRHRQYLPE